MGRGYTYYEMTTRFVMEQCCNFNWSLAGQVVVILFPEEYNITHSICTTFKNHFINVFPWQLPEKLRLIELTTAISTMIQLEGSRVLGGIFYCSQMCRAHYIIKMSGSISMGLIFTYSLMIQHGSNKYDIMTIAKHAHKLLYGVTNLVISFNKVFRDSLSEAFFYTNED